MATPPTWLWAADLPSGHHSKKFDIDEADLARGVEALSLALLGMGSEGVTRT